MKALLFFVTALVLCLSCRARPGIQDGVGAPWIAGPARNDSRAGLKQHPGARLPLDAVLRDASGRSVRLGDFFGGSQPVLLVPGYYRCTELCGLLMHGLLEGLQQAGLPRTDWRIVRVSIADGEGPADAQRRGELDRAYADFLLGATPARVPLHLDLLLADARAAETLERATGWSFEPYRRDTASGEHRTEYAHPATVIVATPDGRISRYLNGVRFDAPELRAALVEASSGRIGGLSDRLALLCAHLVPSFGRHSAAVMDAVRAAVLLVLLAAAVFVWRHRKPGSPA